MTVEFNLKQIMQIQNFVLSTCHTHLHPSLSLHPSVATSLPPSLPSSLLSLSQLIEKKRRDFLH